MGWPGPPTHRQHDAFVWWTSDEFDRPSLTDWYIMQNTAVTFGLGFILGGKNPGLVAKDFRLNREAPPKPKTEAELAEQDRREMKMWLAWAQAPLLRKKVADELRAKRSAARAAKGLPEPKPRAKPKAGPREAAPVPPRKNAGRPGATRPAPRKPAPVRSRRCVDDQPVD